MTGATAGASHVLAAEAHRETFGALADGTPVEAVTLVNGRGMRVRIIAYGAAIQSLSAPDRQGRMADVVLAYPDMGGYLKAPQYFGAIVGRYANRVGGAGFTLDGHAYTLEANEHGSTLHGGSKGFDKALWRLADVSSGAQARATFSYLSRDGEGGFPGNLKVSVTYALDESDALTVRYEATTDRPTVINLSNHSYFNLGGAASGRDILGERLMIAADSFTPVDAHLLPTGEIRSVAGTPFDFRQPTVIDAHIHDGAEPQLLIARGFDQNFALRGGETPAPKLAARVEDPVSGRAMEVWTTEPGVQFYTGNGLGGGVAGKDGYIYRQSDGLALETQHFPDSPHHPDFPSTRLDPGETYRQVTVYRFSAH